MSSILDDIKREFTTGNNITRLILVNVSIFVVMTVLHLFVQFSNPADPTSWLTTLDRNLSLSDDWIFNLTHPWVFVTHMFMHFGLMHLAWNMLFLYWFGRRVGDLIGDQHVYPIYFYGGIAGAIFLMISSSLLGYNQGAEVFAKGASAAVMAFVVAAGVLNPESHIHLILIGPIKLKYVVAVLVFLDIYFMGKDMNTGGHFAHLGGAVMGWFYVYALRNGWNLSPRWNENEGREEAKIRTMTNRPKKSTNRPTPTTAIKNLFASKGENADTLIRNIDEEVDIILEKINLHGIDSLTDEERNLLKRASKDS